MADGMYIKVITVVCFLSGSLLQSVPAQTIFPRSPAVAKEIHVLPLPAGNDTSSEGLRLILLSLQGLVNRDQPKIFLQNLSNQDFLLHYYNTKNYYTARYNYTDAWQLISRFKSAPKGLVVFDPAKPYTINIATDVAGVEDLLITSPEYIHRLQLLGFKVKTDLRKVAAMQDAYSAYRWAYKKYWNRQNHTVLSNVYSNYQFDVLRDYLVAFRIPALWYPGKDNPDYSPALQQFMKHIYARPYVNVPVLGFWPCTNPAGEQMGVSEYEGVKMAGEYGKYTVVADWAGNYSYHSGIPVNVETLPEYVSRKKSALSYDSTKKYVLITMIESGDSPGYYQSVFNGHQWSDSTRGKVAYNYGVAPALQFLLPGLLEYIYTTASANDNFFTSISGMGYMYPLEGYGAKTRHPSKTINDYYKLTSMAMNRMGLHVLSIYTHPYAKWTADDDRFLEAHLAANMPAVSAVLCDMGRLNHMTCATANYMIAPGISVHHCLSRWPEQISGDTPMNTQNDSLMVNWLVSEIRHNSKRGDFAHIMAYSWIYGPRRMKMVADKLAGEGYEFLTLDQFTQLYHSQALKKPLDNKL